ncbi:MAG TPA: VOC family protein [Spirochaetia bacterium]|nr:VOC family protein [Spirochaetia bacterium]
MKPRLNVITLAVSDLEKALAFYRDGLGLPSKGLVGTEFKGSDTEPAGAVAFFELKGGLLFALYPRKDLAKDSRVPNGPSSSVEFSIGYAVESREEVDKLLHQAQRAGAQITDQPHDRAWGIYSGYFADLDGHLWEVLWSPGMPLSD